MGGSSKNIIYKFGNLANMYMKNICYWCFEFIS